MRTLQITKRWFLVFAAVAQCLVGCDNEREFRWEEEVVLSSGETLVLQRVVRLDRTSAPGNPFKFEWGWREFFFVVTEGPPDVRGATYKAPMIPIVIDRDPETRAIVVIGIPISCPVYKLHQPDRGSLYLAFKISGDNAQQQSPIPEWAWDRVANILEPSWDESPPPRVTAAQAQELNRTKGRGDPSYFQIQKAPPFNCER